MSRLCLWNLGSMNLFVLVVRKNNKLEFLSDSDRLFIVTEKIDLSVGSLTVGESNYLLGVSR